MGEVGDTPEVAGLVFPATVGAFSDLTDADVTVLLRWYNVAFPEGPGFANRSARRNVLKRMIVGDLEELRLQTEGGGA